MAISPLLCLGGCGSDDGPKLIDYMEELEFNSQLVSLNEVYLGSYRISSATSNQEAEQLNQGRTWVRIKFQLFVVAAPEHASAIESAYKRYRGVFDDKIIEIFRSATMEELTDPRWATLKARVTDYAKPLLGEKRVRQVVINDYSWEPL